MKRDVLATISICLVAAICANGQLTHRDTPQVQWESRVQAIRGGNGVFLTPDDKMLVASSNLGYISAFGALDGSEIFNYEYVPDTTDVEFISSISGVSFGDDVMVYSVLINRGISNNPMTRVVALSFTGEQIWVSPSLQGLSPGTPVVSGDGKFVYLTHNSDQGNVGHFSILDGTTGDLFFSQVNNIAPFAPLGIFHNPAEGYYDGGQNNRNDILVWSVQPKPSDTSVGTGTTFAFQLPIAFVGDPAALSWIQMGDNVDFQTIQKPVFADNGRTLYWGASRSQFRCWIGEAGLDRNRFSRARTSAIGFSRGVPPMQAVFAAPVLTHDSSNRYIFGGTAAPEFVKMSHDFSQNFRVATNQLVKASAHVSPDDIFVYYVETNGFLHQANTVDLSDRWSLDIGNAVEGEFAMNKEGTMLFIGDASGWIQALRVGDVPTEAPTNVPSSAPTILFTTSPTSKLTGPPTKAPIAASPPPSLRPIQGATPAPTPEPSVTATEGGSNKLTTSKNESAASWIEMKVAFAAVLFPIFLL